MNTIFVYGTLKRGGTNHLFLQGQHYLGAARTVAGYVLYSLGDYPGMVRAPGDTQGVTGELWAVDDACLAELDKAIQQNDESVRARYFRGMIQKRLGNMSAAVRDFQHAARLDPNHLESVRELRVYNMRSGGKKR